MPALGRARIGDASAVATSALGPIDFAPQDARAALTFATAAALGACAAATCAQQAARFCTERPRLLLFPRTQNMLLRAVVPLWAQVGTLALSAPGPDPLTRLWGGALLAGACVLVAFVLRCVRSAARRNDARLVIAPAAAIPLPPPPPTRLRLALLGRGGMDAVWMGEYAATHGNLFENSLDGAGALLSSPLLLAGSLAQAAAAGALAKRAPTECLALVLALQLATAIYILSASPFIDGIRQMCANAASALGLAATCVAMAAPTASADARTAVLVLKMLALFIGMSGSAFIAAKRVLRFDSLRRDVARRVEESEEGMGRPSISCANPLLDGEGGGDRGRSVAEGGGYRGCSSASSATPLVTALVEAKEGEEEGADGRALLHVKSLFMGEDEEVFGSDHCYTRRATIGGEDDIDTYNPMYALAEVGALGGGAFYLDSPDDEGGAHGGGGGDSGGGGDGIGGGDGGGGSGGGGGGGGGATPAVDTRVRTWAMLRTFAWLGARALPSEADAANAANDPRLTASFPRRLEEVRSAMDTSLDLAYELGLGDGAKALGAAASAAVRGLADAPSAAAAGAAARAVYEYLDAISSEAAAVGVVLPAIDEEEEMAGGIERLRSLLSSARGQLNKVGFVNPEDRLSDARRRMYEERAEAERSIERMRRGLRSAASSSLKA